MSLFLLALFGPFIAAALVVLGLPYITHTLTQSWSSSGASIAKSNSINGNEEVNLDVVITAAPTNQIITVAIDVSEVQSMYIVSDVDVTVYANDASGGSPAFSFALKADKPYVWHATDTGAFKFSADVTSFHLYGSGAAGTLKMRSLIGAP